jgi:Lon protease-like protein
MTYSLPLFPLDIVMCPGGLLPLRLFESRYLDMVKNCLRNDSSFAVVAVLPEGTTDPKGNFPFANVGTVFKIIDADVDTVGLMLIRCVGQHRVRIESFDQQADGLIIGQVTDIPNDIELPIPDELHITREVLTQLLEKLIAQNTHPDKLPIKPYQVNDTAWVANRWVELLDLPLLEKQRLMQLDSPVVRLELIQDILTTGNKKTA